MSSFHSILTDRDSIISVEPALTAATRIQSDMSALHRAADRQATLTLLRIHPRPAVQLAIQSEPFPSGQGPYYGGMDGNAARREDDAFMQSTGSIWLTIHSGRVDSLEAGAILVIMRLLVVEDEPDLLESLVQALREDGYAVDGASDGEDGLFKAENADYDAIVLDVMLPLIDGWELLGRLRPTKKTPVLMLTARGAVRDRVQGLDSGADDYLVKPFDLSELLARIRALIRRSASEVRSRMEIGDVVIDMAGRTVSRGGQEIKLTPREYSMVEFLALHRGTVVSRTTLYEHLFDENEDSLSNLLDVHVSNIRKKLGCGFISTRRGHGYCIERRT